MNEQIRDVERIRQRSSAACDACRRRKVKCVIAIDQSKCSICTELGIECTSVRPRKKRGPKNRYVQALRAQLDGDHNPVEDSETGRPHLELIAPATTLHQLLVDWFDWIHPVAPLFHRVSFMQRVAHEDGSAPFFVLLVSVCAATVASLRRRRHLYGGVTVQGCLDLAERFSLWNLSSKITLERALTMYNFSSAAHHEYGLDAAVTHRLSADSAISVKYLIHQELQHMTFMDQQILKRLYWLIFAGQCTGDMHGWQLLILRHAHEHANALLPMEISDDQLLFDAGSPILDGTTSGAAQSYVPGLNALARLFILWQASQAIPTQTMDHLQDHISRAQRALDDLPPELKWSRSEAGFFGFNVQKVNLKVTQLHIRSNLLEQMNALAKCQNMRITPDAIINERYHVVEELLDVLYNMPEEVFDANGYSIVPKIRDIGGALLDELRTGSHGRTLQASLNLDRLLSKLESLDQQPMAQNLYS